MVENRPIKLGRDKPSIIKKEMNQLVSQLKVKF